MSLSHKLALPSLGLFVKLVFATYFPDLQGHFRCGVIAWLPAAIDSVWNFEAIILKVVNIPQDCILNRRSHSNFLLLLGVCLTRTSGSILLSCCLRTEHEGVQNPYSYVPVEAKLAQQKGLQILLNRAHFDSLFFLAFFQCSPLLQLAIGSLSVLVGNLWIDWFIC